MEESGASQLTAFSYKLDEQLKIKTVLDQLANISSSASSSDHEYGHEDFFEREVDIEVEAFEKPATLLAQKFKMHDRYREDASLSEEKIESQIHRLKQ